MTTTIENEKTYTLDQLIENLCEVELTNEDNFKIIQETLTRIGIASQNSKELTQTCHIYHFKNKYFILHFKELFALDGRKCTINEQDYKRRNYIVKNLEKWNLIKNVGELVSDYSNVTFLSSKDSSEWTLNKKYILPMDSSNISELHKNLDKY